MKLVAALACRNNSSRLYGKPMQLLGSYSVLEYIVNNLKNKKEIDDIVLAISEAKGNEIFLDFAEKNNLKYIVGNDKDMLDRTIKACEYSKGDMVYRVTTESPFGYIEGLSKALESHIQNKADYTCYANLPDGVGFEIINLTALKKAHSEGDSRHRTEYSTMFIYENPNIFNLNIIPIAKELQRPDYRLTIDYPEDLILCRKIIQHFDDNIAIPYQKLIDFLDQNPKLVEINKNLTDNNYVKPYA